jgi:hypothetical protein
MALAARDLGREELLARYRRSLMKYGQEPRPPLPPGQDVRTCSNCGRHTRFRLDPEGTWFSCTLCGHFA